VWVNTEKERESVGKDRERERVRVGKDRERIERWGEREM
jgi:hypothetical protein